MTMCEQDKIDSIEFLELLCSVRIVRIGDPRINQKDVTGGGDDLEGGMPVPSELGVRGLSHNGTKAKTRTRARVMRTKMTNDE
jgi:hypothetical protein